MPITITGGLSGGGGSAAAMTINGAINGNIAATAAQDLRRQNGTPYNQVPYAAPFDCTLTELFISNDTTNSYSIGVYVDNTLVFTGIRANGQRVQSFPMAIAVTKNQQIRLRFMAGVGSTNRPAAQLLIRETL